MTINKNMRDCKFLGGSYKGSLRHEKDQLSFPLSHEMCTFDNNLVIIMVHSVVIDKGYFYHHNYKKFL